MNTVPDWTRQARRFPAAQQSKDAPFIFVRNPDVRTCRAPASRYDALPMAYQVFARKYRPQTFTEIVGQEPVVRTLTNALRLGRIAQAYLFVGPRGTGKTSTARILAKALEAGKAPSADFDPKEDICAEIAEGR